MNYVEAPEEMAGRVRAVFLAGGITDADDWQSIVVEQLRYTRMTVLNPRRKAFSTGDPDATKQQIAWEWRHLRRADLVAFWFPPPTLCPIALFELGTCCSAGVPLVVGADAGYARRADLAEQLRLRRPEVELLSSLDDLAERIARHPALVGEER